MHLPTRSFFPFQWANRERLASVLGIGILPFYLRFDGRVKVGQLPPFEVETAAVLLGNIVVINVCGQCRVDVLRGEDEDLGDGDWIKPTLDPAPDSWEETWRADDL